MSDDPSIGLLGVHPNVRARAFIRDLDPFALRDLRTHYARIGERIMRPGSVGLWRLLAVCSR